MTANRGHSLEAESDRRGRRGFKLTLVLRRKKAHRERKQKSRALRGK